MLKHLKIFTCILLGLLPSNNMFAQTISYLDSSQKGVSFRGLSAVTNNVFWVSGSKGTVGRSLDGGQHFEWVGPKSFEKTDFRDIEAFDDKTAIIMGIDSPGVILKTKDGGANWKVVYRNDMHGIFLDAMAFKNNLRGVCVGDPIDNHFWLMETKNGGESWTEVPLNKRPVAEKGEACFASSGTNIGFIGRDSSNEYVFVSGGTNSRSIVVSNILTTDFNLGLLPIMKNTASTGGNSIAMNSKSIVVAGGDFTNYKRSDSTFAYWDWKNSPKKWETTKKGMFGYKSCIIFKDEKTLIATGLSGTDITINGIANWKHFSDLPFHVVQKAKNGTAVYLAGGNGRIAKIIF